MRRLSILMVELVGFCISAQFGGTDLAGAGLDQAKGSTPPAGQQGGTPPAGQQGSAPPAGQQGGTPPATQKGAQSGLPTQPMPGQPGYFGYTQTPWFGSQGVQQQLNLTNQQMQQLNNAYNQGWNTYSKGLGSLGTLSEQQRAQRMQELNGTFNTDLSKSAQGTLSPQQFQRFQQLNWQYHGLNAFNDPAISGKLNLTPAQKQQIDALRAEQNKTLTTIQGQMSTDPTAAANQFQAYRTQTQEQLNNILSPQQRQTWSQIMGEPYDFTPEGLRMQKK